MLRLTVSYYTREVNALDEPLAVSYTPWCVLDFLCLRYISEPVGHTDARGRTGNTIKFSASRSGGYGEMRMSKAQRTHDRSDVTKNPFYDVVLRVYLCRTNSIARGYKMQT